MPVTATAPVDIFDIDGDQAADLIASLTPREREVCGLVATGMRQRDIAEHLAISVKTLDIHRQRVARKLGTKPTGFGRIWYAAKVHGGNGSVDNG